MEPRQDGRTRAGRWLRHQSGAAQGRTGREPAAVPGDGVHRHLRHHHRRRDQPERRALHSAGTGGRGHLQVCAGKDLRRQGRERAAGNSNRAGADLGCGCHAQGCRGGTLRRADQARRQGIRPQPSGRLGRDCGDLHRPRQAGAHGSPRDPAAVRDPQLHQSVLNEEPAMKKIVTRAVSWLPSLALVLTAASSAYSQTKSPEYETARDAYVYAYPIVTMDVSMRQSTNVPDAKTIPLRAPINQFAHARTYPRAEDRDVVRYNFDTLYSFAWLDLTREPMVLSVPDTNGRYYLLPMLDMWTDVFSVVGSRTTGTKAGNFALVGPGWNGRLPDGVTRINAPTSNIWILGRTQTNGPADYENVHKVQDGYKLTSLSQWGTNYAPPATTPTDPAIDNKTPPLVQVNRMDGVTVLGRLAELLAKNPPHANDYPILFRMRQIGFEPDKPFDVSKLDPALVKTINAAAKDALVDLEQSGKSGAGIGLHVNGWFYQTSTVGTYGTAYKLRAMGTLIGLGVNLPEDAVYPASFVDGEGKPYSGANRYVLHFEKGQLPPAAAFWSVTLYDKDGFQAPNALSRFALGDRDKLKFNPNGSLDLYIQHESPGPEKESNWLPAPAAEFNLAMRLYSPRREALDGIWAPPPVNVAK